MINKSTTHHTRTSILNQQSPTLAQPIHYSFKSYKMNVPVINDLVLMQETMAPKREQDRILHSNTKRNLPIHKKAHQFHFIIIMLLTNGLSFSSIHFFLFHR